MVAPTKQSTFTVVARHRNTDGALITAAFGALLCTVFWANALFPSNRPVILGQDLSPAEIPVPLVVVLSVLSCGPIYLLCKFLYPG